MRRIARPPMEIFTLSFLDIISCAFGAIVMLVLLAKNGEETHSPADANLSVMINAKVKAQQSVDNLRAALSNQQAELASVEEQASAAQEQQGAYESSIPRAQQTLQVLQGKADALRTEIKRMTAQINTPNAEPDEDMGGIPTDAEYVMFIIDTSGSMQNIWRRVMAIVTDILNNHPEVKGFNFMSDNGEFLYSQYKGKWITDTPSMRRTVLKTIDRRWSADSNSSPIDGIELGLSLYAKQDKKMAFYVFGDDYRGTSFEGPVSRISGANKDANGDTKIRIHGVGFANGNDYQFAALMRAIAERNNGTFIALSQ